MVEGEIAALPMRLSWELQSHVHDPEFRTVRSSSWMNQLVN